MSPTRSALLVATDDYSDIQLSRLPGTIADVDSLAAILGDPTIGDFTTRRLTNEPSYRVNEEIEGFFGDAHFDDFLVLYVTGHGLKDDGGRLYFATCDTRATRLSSSTVSSAFVQEQMAGSRCRRIFVILDCCFSGAFSLSAVRRAGEHVDALARLAARGCAVLTSSTALEYSFELSAGDDPVSELKENRPSVFTEALVRGLGSGEADLDADGLIELGELYEYVFRAVRATAARQTPKLSSELEGPFYIAYSRRGRGMAALVDQEKTDDTSPVQSSRASLTVRVNETGVLDVSFGRRGFVLAGSALLVRPRFQPRIDATGNWELDITPLEGDYHHFPQFVRSHWPDLSLSQPPDRNSADWLLKLPGGNAFGGSLLSVQVHGLATSYDRISLLETADPTRLHAFATETYPGLLIVAHPEPDRAGFSMLDKKAVRRQLRGDPLGRGGIVVPRAYEFDDLTYGVLWAAANLDDSLVADNIALTQGRRRLRSYEGLKSSAVSREAASDLNIVSQMWLGSDFCARYILGQIKDWSDVPLYWTREKSGEEASTWLLVRHKYAYLRKTGRRYVTSPDPSMRAFCIPEDDIRPATTPQRLLILLAVALMEMLHIRIWVCVDPEYTAVEGFVLAPRRHGLIANWVRGDGIWHVDSVGRGATVVGFGDAIKHAVAHSVVVGETSAERLMSLATYLDLDWNWLRRRCAELGQVGWGNLVSPRSSLLTVEALDAVCRFVGRL